MKVIVPPHRVKFDGMINVFLAGSIEMGEATEWQKKAIELFEARVPSEHKDLFQILNPRRPDWDPNWKQDYEDPQFYQQVKWELKCLDECNIILLYLDPATKSPISLLELGKHHDKMVIVCPEGYWRKGNVDIFCDHYQAMQVSTLEEGVDTILEQISNNH